jgi:hypothetical protein
MRTAIILFIIFFIPAIGFSATIYVPDDYPTIQDAINASINGDTVIVRPGTYVENIDFMGKATLVSSEKGPSVTIIDGDNKERVVNFNSLEGQDSILDGFTITKGFETTTGGGGIYCGENTSPLIINNVITLNTTSKCGGGIFCAINSAPTIRNNWITYNNSDSGGAIQCGVTGKTYPTIDGNIIAWNTVSWDGGAIDTGPYVCEGVISNNIIHNNKSGHNGGGIWAGSSV